jgi:hypothetical protein
MGLAVPRIPVYCAGMDRKTRYRRRIKVQAAMTRLMEALGDLALEGVPPDRTTALMAWQVAETLRTFIRRAGLNDDDEPDRSRFLQLKHSRQRESAARRHRKARRSRC